MKTRAAILSIIVASVGALLVWMYLRRFEAEASGGPKLPVLMALRTIEPGEVIKEEDLGTQWIPLAYVESRAIRASDRPRIVNLRAAVPLQAQQSLMWTDIVQNNDVTSLSTIVQPDMRAVTIHAEGRAQALVRPGDRVDVIGTLLQSGSTDNRAGVVLLQNVLVLGRSIDPMPRAGDTSDIVLSLTLQQAQVVAVAAEKGKLSVALRAPSDVKLVQGLSDVTSKSLEKPEERAPLIKPNTGPTIFK